MSTAQPLVLHSEEKVKRAKPKFLNLCFYVFSNVCILEIAIPLLISIFFSNVHAFFEIAIPLFISIFLSHAIAFFLK